MTDSLRPIEELSEKQQKFIHYCAEGDSKADAYSKAGYSGEGATLTANARKLYRQLRPYIDEAVRERWTSVAPQAISTVVALLTASSEAVRLNAAIKAISGAGLDKPQEIKLITDPKEMSTTDIMSELEKLIVSNPRLKVLNGGSK